jgi:hypothetical protein
VKDLPIVLAGAVLAIVILFGFAWLLPTLSCVPQAGGGCSFTLGTMG